MTDQLTFQYEAAGRDGRVVKGMVGAADEAGALRRLAADGLTVLRIRPAAAPKAEGRERGLRAGERVLVLRQMALMLEAGVSLLEALDTVAQGMQARKGRRQFQAAIGALRRGESLGEALETHAPGFPDYVYAMARVGEASGRIAEVLKEAAEQMAYEDRLQRDFANAMTYPAFLCCAGVAAVGFIFTQVVPRFGAMIGEDRENIPAMSRWVLETGEFANANLGLVGIGAVLLLSAAALARAAVPIGPFRQGLDLLDSDLRAGMTLDASLGAHTGLEAMDLSLLRAGQKSGAIGAMFGFMADNYEARLRDRMKRMTALLEPMAIGIISIVVGFVALSLVLALSSVYEGVV